MLIAEPQPTPADLLFELAGIRIRVSPWFWLGAAFFGWRVCQMLSRAVTSGPCSSTS